MCIKDHRNIKFSHTKQIFDFVSFTELYKPENLSKVLSSYNYKNYFRNIFSYLNRKLKMTYNRSTNFTDTSSKV